MPGIPSLFIYEKLKCQPTNQFNMKLVSKFFGTNNKFKPTKFKPTTIISFKMSTEEITVSDETLLQFYNDIYQAMLSCNGDIKTIRKKFKEMDSYLQKTICLGDQVVRTKKIKECQICARTVVERVANNYSQLGNIKVIKFLAKERNVYVNRIGNGCVLKAALNSRNMKLIKYLVEEADANIFGQDTLLSAVTSGWFECVQYFIAQSKKKGKNYPNKDTVLSYGYDKETLENAIKNCKLIVNATTVNGDFPGILECLQEHLDNY